VWLCRGCGSGRPLILDLGHQIAEVFLAFGHELPHGIREREHREILAFNQSNANRRLACRLPRYTGIGIQLLREVDEIDEGVTLLHINGRGL
jgi:hypothetical protein